MGRARRKVPKAEALVETDGAFVPEARAEEHPLALCMGARHEVAQEACAEPLTLLGGSDLDLPHLDGIRVFEHLEHAHALAPERDDLKLATAEARRPVDLVTSFIPRPPGGYEEVGIDRAPQGL